MSELLVFFAFFFITKEADKSPQIRMGAFGLKHQVNKWKCSPSRQPLIVFHRDKMQFVLFLHHTSKGSGASTMTHCAENVLFRIEENQICGRFLHFFVRLRSFDKAVTVNGWISWDKTSDMAPLVAGGVIPLSANDIIFQPGVSLCLSHSEWREKTK